MIYSHLKRTVELDKQLEKKYGKIVIDKETNSQIGWTEVVTILRFGRQWKSHPDFLEEQKIFGGVPKEVFEIKEKLIKELPFWIQVIT